MRKKSIFSYNSGWERDLELMHRLFANGLESIYPVESSLYKAALPRFAKRYPVDMTHFLNNYELGEYKLMVDNSVSTVYDELAPFSDWDITEYWLKESSNFKNSAIRTLDGIGQQLKMSEELALELAIRYLQVMKYSTRLPYTAIIYRLFSDEIKKTPKFQVFLDLLTNINYQQSFLRFIHDTPDNPVDFLTEEENNDVLVSVCTFIGSYKRVSDELKDWLLSVLPYTVLLNMFNKNELLPGQEHSDFLSLKLRYSKAIPMEVKDVINAIIQADEYYKGLSDSVSDGSFFKYASILAHSLKEDEWKALVDEFPVYAEEIILITADDSFFFHPKTVEELNKNPFPDSIKYFKMNDKFSLSYNLYLILLNVESIPSHYVKVLKRIVAKEIFKSTGIMPPEGTPMNWLMDILKANIETDGAIPVSSGLI